MIILNRGHTSANLSVVVRHFLRDETRASFVTASGSFGGYGCGITHREKQEIITSLTGVKSIGK